MAFRRRRGSFRRRRRMRRRGGYKSTFSRKRGGGARRHKPELKYFDISDTTGVFPFTTMVSAPTFITLNAVPEGAGANNRVGRRINMKSLQIRVNPSELDTLVLPASTNCFVWRVVIVYDSQANGAMPAMTDIFAGTLFAGTNAGDIHAPVNLNNRDRFLILRDKLYTYNFESGEGFGTADGGMVGYINRAPWVLRAFIKLNGLETTYSATSAVATQLTAASITTGSLLVGIQCGSITYDGVYTAATGVRHRVTSRIRFYD